MAASLCAVWSGYGRRVRGSSSSSARLPEQGNLAHLCHRRSAEEDLRGAPQGYQVGGKPVDPGRWAVHVEVKLVLLVLAPPWQPRPLLSLRAHVADAQSPPHTCVSKLTSCVAGTGSPLSRASVLGLKLIQVLPDNSQLVDLGAHFSLALAKPCHELVLRTLRLVLVPLSLPDVSILACRIELSFDQLEELVQPWI